MQEIADKNKCCGCSACVNICPKGAISMKADEKGFKYPVIDQKKCINCSLCKKTCPVLKNNEDVEKEIKAYACYNVNDQERLKSSSGGIFVLLAKEIIKRNGVVFGATFDKDFNVYHKYVEKEEDLEQFMGSKYTQSNIGNSYRDAKEFLDRDRYVLFSGTPCQIEGLKSYLGKDYLKLYTQDIICHGVPSPKVWQKYLNYQSEINKERIRNVSFRNKDQGWSLFRTKVLFDTRTYSEEHDKDLFMKAFLNNICLRESCYNCSFKKMHRLSDITLADYWGIKKIHPEMNDDKGTSLVIINSKNGKELFEKIKEKTFFKETDLDQALKYNISMIKSVNHPKNEKAFFDNLDNMSMEELVKKFIPKPTLVRRIKDKLKRLLEKFRNN